MNVQAFLNYNGKVYRNDKLLISPGDKSFRYGDGCFETMKMVNGKILLESYHFERLFSSLQALQFNKPNYFITDAFKDEIVELAKKNHHKKLARIRITISRGEGGLFENENNKPNYVIQTWDLNSSNNKLNENGMVMNVFTKARKICDEYSYIKSNSALCYALGAIWAKQHKLNDVVILNPFDRVADSTIANIFIVQDGIIKTPPLSEGCIAGVCRKYLLNSIKEEGLPFQETSITVNELMSASELFLTNSMYGIRWVKELGKSNYKNQLAPFLFKKFITPLF
jgi:branched-chain amino acid aminotransferase